MKRKNLFAGNVKFLKNVVLIYIFIIVICISAINHSSITNLALAGPYSGPDYYVNGTSGDNGNNGSFNYPFRTIEYAISQTDSGDTIQVMAGIYTPTSPGNLLISGKNTVGSWYTIKNYNNGKVIIDGTNCPTTEFYSIIQISNCKYIRITGLTMNHSKNGGIWINGPCSFIIIDNCTISNSSCFAIKLLPTGGSAHNIIFEHNYLYNNFNDWSSITMGQETISFESVTYFSINNNTLIGNHAENIDVKGACNHGVICHNIINTTGGYLHKGGEDYYGGPGFMIDARGKVDNISFYNNNIYGNNTGIELEDEGSSGHFEYIYIYNNIINITGTGGAPTFSDRVPLMICKPGSTTEVFHHIYIYNNLIRSGPNNGYSIFQVGAWDNPQFGLTQLKNVHIVNNIFTTTDTGTRYLMRFASITWEQGLNMFIINNNSFYRSTGLANMLVHWGSDYSAASNTTVFGGEPIFTNPKFVYGIDQGGDFHLQSDSPCIDVGNNALVPSFDFDGFSRPQGSGVDIGAFEFPSGGGDATPPQISVMSIITSNPLDTNPLYGWINVSCTVTDNVAVSQVILQIHNSGGSWNNVSMITRTTGKYYYRSTTAFSTAGNYSYIVWAKDASNNVKTSSSLLFSMPPNWDINNDNCCTILDLVIVSNQYGSAGSPGWLREDMDNSGVINILDMNLISNHFGENWYT